MRGATLSFLTILIVAGCDCDSTATKPLTREEVAEIARSEISAEFNRRDEQAEADRELQSQALAAELNAQSEADLAERREREAAKERVLSLMSPRDQERVKDIRKALAIEGIWIKQSDLQWAMQEGGDVLIDDVAKAAQSTNRGSDYIGQMLKLTPLEKTLLAAEFTSAQRQRIEYNASKLLKERPLPGEILVSSRRFWPLKYLMDDYAKELQQAKQDHASPQPASP